MTSGSKVIDERSFVSRSGVQACNGTPTVYSNIRVGRYRSKSWSGGDAPKTSKRPFTYRVFSYPVWDKRGRMHMRTRRVKVYGPKGPRPDRGEHGYSSTIQDNLDTVVETQGPFPSVCTNGRIFVGFASSENFDTLDSRDDYWSSNDDISLIGKLSDKISGSAFNMLVFLGEGKESLETVAAASTRIYRALKALRRGNPARAARELVGARKVRKFPVNKFTGRPDRTAAGVVTDSKWLSERWLELQYGWKPLLNDIWNAMEHFAHMQSRPQVMTYRVSKWRGGEKLHSASPSYEIYGTAKFQKRIKAIVSKIDEVALLGLTDPASLAWEKLPYSFVADWFIPIGNYLEAINLQKALRATYVTTEYFKVEATSVKSSPGSAYHYSGAYFRHLTLTSSRTLSSSLPVPLPGVKPWSKIASWAHAANAVALISGLFRPNGRSREVHDTTQIITSGESLYKDWQRFLEERKN